MTFDAIDTTKGCITLMTGMLGSMTFNKERMERSAQQGFSNATDAADYLVRKGVPFRDAHGMIGRLVLRCISLGVSMDELPLAEYRAESESFDEDIYQAISLKSCVSKRLTKGAPGGMPAEIAGAKAFLSGIS